MKEKLEEIKAHASGLTFETMNIVADFTKLLTMDDYRDTIESKLRDLDVSILILNAGMTAKGPMEMITES